MTERTAMSAQAIPQAVTSRSATLRSSRRANAGYIGRQTTARSPVAQTSGVAGAVGTAAFSSRSRSGRLGALGALLISSASGHRRGYYRGGMFGGRHLSAGYYPEGYWGGGAFLGSYYDPGYYPTDMVYEDDVSLGAPVIESQGLSYEERQALQGLPPLSDSEFATAEGWDRYRQGSPQRYAEIAENDSRVRLLMERFDATVEED